MSDDFACEDDSIKISAGSILQKNDSFYGAGSIVQRLADGYNEK